MLAASGQLPGGCNELDREPPPPQSQTRAAGLITSGIFLGQFVNPFLVAPLRAVAGLAGSFLLVGGALLVAALLLAFFATRLDPESEMLGRS